MWPFRTKPIVDDETAAWHVDNLTWLIGEFGGSGATDATQLVLPRPGFFRTDGETGHALALRIFRQVQAYCGMQAWEIELVADDNPAAIREAPSYVMVAPVKHAVGTYSIDGNRAVITYVPALLERPNQLIATFAHEIAHDLLSTAKTAPPCEDDEMEFLTDLTAVFLGFGVFLANARFDFETLGGGGWRMGRTGYLPEADIVFALAAFLRLKGLEAGAAGGCLKPHLVKLLRRALSDLPPTHRHVVELHAALTAGRP
jgi:hypothetical protein